MKAYLRNVALAILVMLAIALIIGAARARDNGQWNDPANAEIKRWFEELRQPDHPTWSCCGEADAYWADVVHVRNGKTFAVITDDRDDAPLGRPHIPFGTEIEVPNYKLKWDAGNPTGHAVIFLAHGWGQNEDGKPDYIVYCFVQNGGV